MVKNSIVELSCSSFCSWKGPQTSTQYFKRSNIMYVLMFFIFVYNVDFSVFQYYLVKQSSRSQLYWKILDAFEQALIYCWTYERQYSEIVK